MNKLTDKNRLSLLFKNLINEWNIKNKLTPQDFSYGSSKKVWWICANGHEWEARIKDRTKNKQGCPYCNRKSILEDESVGILYPNLNNETEENLYLYFPGSGKKILWKCIKGHSWKTEIRVRVNGSNCPYCVGNIPTKETSFEYLYPELLNEWDYEKNEIFPSQLKPQSNKIIWWKCNKDHSWKTYLYNRTYHKTQCPICKISSGQKEVYEFIKTLNINVIINDRTALNGKEIDIYCPENNIGIEYNGLYYHSEMKNDNKKHLIEKTELGNKNNIFIFHIFSNEWEKRQEIIKSMLKYKLNKISKTFQARKLKIKQVDVLSRKKFFEENHLEGDNGAIVAFGLYDNDILVSCISLKNPIQKKYKNNKLIEIMRFASLLNCHVVGGFSKLFKLAQKWAIENGYKGFYTYAHIKNGTGNVYLKNGFKFIGKTPIDYFYTDRNNVFHRTKFKAKGNKTEKQIADEAGVFKVYGCGSFIYLYEF